MWLFSSASLSPPKLMLRLIMIYPRGAKQLGMRLIMIYPRGAKQLGMFT